jgi:transglutaminase-like putative cysteine protease
VKDAHPEGRHDLDEVCVWRALFTNAAILYGVFVGARVGSALSAGAASHLPVATALLAVVFLPYLFVPSLRAARRLLGRPVVAVVPASLLQLAPFPVLVSGHPAQLAASALVFLAGHLFAHARDVRAAVFALGIGPLYVLLEMAAQPSASWLIAFAACVAVSTTGAVFLARRENHRWVRRRAPRLLQPRGEVLSGASAVVTPGRPAPLITTLQGLLLGTAVLLLVPLFYLPIAFLPDPELASGNGRFDPAAGGSELERGDRRRDGAREDARQTLDRIFPGELGLNGFVDPLEHELVMEVVPEPARDVGPLYFRGMVLDTIVDVGVSLLGGTRSVRVRDADDGAIDGWVELDGRRPARGDVVLQVRQQALRIRDGAWSVVFSPRPLLAVRLPEVELDPHGVTLTPSPDADWIELSLRHGSRPTMSVWANPEPDPRTLQLPLGSPALVPIRRLAQDLTQHEVDDAGRVRAVLDHFRDGFAYDLEATEFPGLDGVARFLERRRGHCSYYAVAATLMLRSVGIPTRVATGFLATEWDAEAQRYVVTTRNGHAWIEVDFLDRGWVPLDPTPAATREAALAAAGGEPGRGLGAWGRALVTDLARWVETGDRSVLRDLAATLADGPRALLASVLERPWVLLPLGLALTLLGHRLRSRPAQPRADRAPASGLPAQDLLERLFRSLAALGHRRRPSQTLREFADQVTAGGVPLLQPLGPWTDRLVRARYGKDRLTPAERADLGRFVDEIARAGRA